MPLRHDSTSRSPDSFRLCSNVISSKKSPQFTPEKTFSPLLFAHASLFLLLSCLLILSALYYNHSSISPIQ